MVYAPIYIPTLCRYEHFHRCMESLKRNGWASHTDVFIGLDYPPSEKYRPGWEKIKDYLATSDFSVFASFTVFERDKNMGASANSRATRKHIISLGFDRWIYAEDDLEFSPNFIEYIDKCLDYFEDDPDVIGVTGYSYPLKWSVSSGATCFKQNNNASTWGTGYWLKKQIPVMNYLENKGLKRSVNKVLQKKLYERMIDTAKIEYFNEAFSIVHYLPINWMRTTSDMAIRAYLAVEDKCYVTPVVSKTRNHGFDGTGANTQNNKGTKKDSSLYTLDDACSFNLVVDDLHDYEENKKIMNNHERKNDELLKRTRLLIWMATHIGSWLSKFILLLLVPIDLCKIVIAKQKKTNYKH